MIEGDIVKYTREYLNILSGDKEEDKAKEMVIIKTLDYKDTLLIKDKEDKTGFTKRYILDYWVYKAEVEAQ